MVKALVLAALCVGCSTGAWRVADGTSLALSTAALVADAAQTRSAAADGWAGRTETGWPAAPVMGGTPGVHTVELYFATAIALNAAVWVLLPARWRSVIPGVVIGAQAPVVIGNLKTTSVFDR
jgi:hypothetical protein